MKNLKSIPSDHLWEETKSLAREERRIGVEILWHLREIQVRRLHEQRGFSSLHEFCVQELGYSDGAAQRRIQSMKLLVEIPELQEKLEAGALNMTTVATVGTFIRAEQKLGKSYDLDAKRGLLTQIEGKSRRETESLLAEISPESIRPDRERVVDEESVELRLTVPKVLLEKLQRVREKSSHRNANPSYAELLEMLADSFLQEPAPPEELPVQKNPDARRPERKVERFIRKRDENRCQYRDPKTGRACGSRFFTQIDHIRPYAMGGPTKAENLRVFCGAHNRLRQGNLNEIRVFNS